MASRPVLASPTTLISPSDSISDFKDFRKIVLSSARRTVICFTGRESASGCFFILIRQVLFRRFPISVNDHSRFQPCTVIKVRPFVYHVVNISLDGIWMKWGVHPIGTNEGQGYLVSHQQQRVKIARSDNLKGSAMHMQKKTLPSAETAERRRIKALATTNRELRQEIVRRHKVELALKKSEAHYAQLFEQSLKMQNQLRYLSRQLLIAQEEERKRISRELHDEIVQTLVGINVHLSSLKINARVNIKELLRKISKTQRLVEKSVNIVHRFARELRPTVLDDLGLIPALQSFIKDFAKRTKIRINFTASPGLGQLSSTQRTVFYRVAQSALTNVERHARASDVKFSICKLRSAVRMEIHDNGKSFDVERVLSAQRYKRLGLLGSRERVEMVGGKFGVVSAPGKGTTISAEIPLTG